MQKYSFKPENFSGVKANLVLETAVSKEICITLEDKSVMRDHKAPAPIVVQVLQGEIEFGVGGEFIILKEFDLIALDANVTHSLKAKGNSIVRLTLSNTDNLSRVFSVVK
ncbi:cupin domain-containing protein [Campylobacter geochelonis]|uniref:cupin domain-containing protein n=1 Tax=Campylobacter geochelonis TaxID=1780362 RepID=UPI000770917F|nr:cupin domain-containing protein [Campylobacter geochelonis]CZE49097.1 cupin [Campylobacter geochelonis]